MLIIAPRSDSEVCPQCLCVGGAARSSLRGSCLITDRHWLMRSCCRSASCPLTTPPPLSSTLLPVLLSVPFISSLCFLLFCSCPCFMINFQLLLFFSYTVLHFIPPGVCASFPLLITSSLCGFHFALHIFILFFFCFVTFHLLILPSNLLCTSCSILNRLTFP